MEYSRNDEDIQNLINQPLNREDNQYNLNLLQSNNQELKWIYVNPSIYKMYCLLNGISVVLGCFLKLIYLVSRNTIGKNSILTGIPIIRNYYFFFPLLLNTIYFIWFIYKFYTNASIRNIYKGSLFTFLKNIRGAFFFTNILLIIIFYVLYNIVVLSIYKSYRFKISGHIIASILSGGMIVNLHNTYTPFISLKIAPKFNKYISYANIFLYYHSIYTVFWSAWIFHQATEIILAFLIAVSSLVLAHVVNIDELFLNLIDFNNPGTNSNILYK